MQTDQDFMQCAYQQALKSYNEGGIPIGAVLVEDGAIISQGHNKRVQEGNQIRHGEMDCFAMAGRRKSFKNTTLYTTLSPCMMCAGAIVQFKVPRVVIGENKNFAGNIPFLEEHGVEVTLLNDPACEALLERFIAEKPELWAEDITKEA